MLAMANWSSTCRSRTPSALPTAPLQVPSAVITVAVIPPLSPKPSLSTKSSSAACSLVANPSVTGSSLMAANLATGKRAADVVEVVDGDGGSVDPTGDDPSSGPGVEEHADSTTARA